ncbi:receptor-like protein 2 [Panicum hallii]|uniref:receptor-like protein 2 n=1 Tax=Panicum hallii TaxID=206008 RepID=UPI000DF4F0C4|nr:receptor-like protein 2 [Panicum hallii]
MPFFGLPLVLLLIMASPATSCNEEEKSSLIQFIAGLSHDGGVTMSWRNGTDCCKWEGITCNGRGAVMEVSLAYRSLEGSISPSLGKLTSLLRLNLSYNSLSGNLPSELLSSGSITVLDLSFNRLSGALQEPHPSITEQPLQTLNISSNLFTGEFPSTMWEKTRNLIAINASNNSFQGWIPSSFCINSTSVALLDLSFNQFSGSIPAGMGKCSALRVLKAGHSHLSGLLPDELFNATSLEYLSFPNNRLQGLLDGAQIMKLRNLVNLDLGGNRLNGKIPESIGQLKRLEGLHLNNNNMFGELPSALSNCTNIITIDLKDNNFCGELHKVNFFNLLNLKALDLLYNNFTGTIPESIYSCSNLMALRLSSNNLHGQLSPRIRNLKYLVFLSLGANNFTNITNTLQILKNWELPTALMEMTMLRTEKTATHLDLRVFELPLYFAHSFQYRIATTFGKTLDLSRNELTGVIPQEIVQLKSLEKLNLSFNGLSGEIPQQLSKVTNLQILDLSSNHLTGAIPSALNNLHFLSVFNVSHNDLEGPIPNGGQLSTFPSSSFDGNSKLCGIMAAKLCGSAEAPPVSVPSTGQTVERVAFVISFGAFFGVGVIYDQIVLSRYFG